MVTGVVVGEAVQARQCRCGAVAKAKAMAFPVAHSAPLDRSRVRNFKMGLAAIGDLLSYAPTTTVFL